MNKMITFAVIAGGALTLAACGGNTQETPAEATDTEMAPVEEAPVGETPATDEAAAAAEGIDPNGNPIGPAAEAE